MTGKDSSIASLYVSYDDDTALDTIEKKLALDANLDGNIRPSDLARIVTALTFDDFSGMGIKRTR